MLSSRRWWHLFAEFEENLADHIGEYSQANMAFHKAIIRMGGCDMDGEAFTAISCSSICARSEP